jgi:hypothetical protein
MGHVITLGDVLMFSGAVIGLIAVLGILIFVLSAIAAGFKD